MTVLPAMKRPRVRAQQQQRAVEIPGLAEAGPSGWRAHAWMAVEIFVVDLGLDETRRNGIHAHALEGELDRQRIGELHDTSFATDQAARRATRRSRRSMRC